MKIENIPIDEIDKLTFEQLFAIQNSKEFQESKDVYEIGDVYELEFGFVKDIQTDIEDNELNLLSQIEYLKKITDKKLYLLETILTCNYLVENIIKLLENESILLGGQATPEQKEAGVDAFAELGVFGQIRSLAGNDVTRVEQVRKTKYSICFMELIARKKESDYESKLNEIYRRKK